jgi:hypothetical protein
MIDGDPYRNGSDFDDCDLTGNGYLRERQGSADIDDRDDVSSQIYDPEDVRWSGRNWEKLLGYDDFRQDVDRYGVEFFTDPDKANPYVVVRSSIARDCGTVYIGQTASLRIRYIS